MLENYLKQFPQECSRLEGTLQDMDTSLSLKHFLATTAQKNLYHRKNFIGHLTASAFILSADGKRVLLLHHKSLDRWLQPGGHIDATDKSILDAAYREVEEETKLSRKDLTLLLDHPFDIDSHPIPANPKKKEAAHVHHDIRYLLQVKNSVTVEVIAEESNGFRWVCLEELHKMEDDSRVAEKIVRARPPR